MPRKNRNKFDLAYAGVFQVKESDITPSMGFRVFSEALPGQVPGRPRELREEDWAKWAKVWARDGIMEVAYYANLPRPAGLPHGFDTIWTDSPGDLFTLAARPAAGHRFWVVGLRQQDFEEAFLDFLDERLVNVFDVLRPDFGWADSVDALGMDEEAPWKEVHWMNFWSPGKADPPKMIHDRSLTLEKRPWGGMVLRNRSAKVGH